MAEVILLSYFLQVNLNSYNKEKFIYRHRTEFYAVKRRYLVQIRMVYTNCWQDFISRCGECVNSLQGYPVLTSNGLKPVRCRLFTA